MRAITEPNRAIPDGILVGIPDQSFIRHQNRMNIAQKFPLLTKSTKANAKAASSFEQALSAKGESDANQLETSTIALDPMVLSSSEISDGHKIGILLAWAVASEATVRLICCAMNMSLIYL